MTTAAPRQRTYDDVRVGDQLQPVEFPLSIYRLVVAAGGNRDFNSIHHNPSYARATGAPTSYASTFFLMGTWERLVRDFIGTAGTIRSISNFRMRKFNLTGSVMTVGGSVVDKRLDGDVGVLKLEVCCRVGDDITVGPGQVTVTLPRSPAG
jgi:acyl dehydratase